MGRKPIERKYIKPTDGRKNNGRQKGDNYKKPRVRTSSAMNKAKKERINLYAVNSMTTVFGSEKEAFESLAQLAKDGSFPHMKLLLEYAYGKPEDLVPSDGKKNGATFNIQNIFTGNSTAMSEDDTEFEVVED